MKAKLELCIEHLQSEVDYFQSSMEECIAELDFDGAKSFHEAHVHTTRKLSILKCLDNPNYIKIKRIEGSISRLEKSLTENNYDNSYLDE